MESQGVCTAVLGSMTAALRAERVLAAASIRVTVVKIGSERTRSGCAYGISFPCMQARNVTDILAENGIRVRRTYGEGL